MSRSRTVVMAGPSLPSAFRPADDRFEWLPPAGAGDIAALLGDPPQLLCLIDGFFDSRPAPWHKELMLLMAAGTTVLGAASMGALRAAELDRHGMIGVGAIYAAYRDGLLTGDDEVALIHATERLDWVPMSVPLVEVRATLSAACRRHIIDVALARRIRTAVAAIHFTERDWPMIGDRLTGERLCEMSTVHSIEQLHVPLKRFDALACITFAMHKRLNPSPPPLPPMTSFVTNLLRERAGAAL